MTDADRFKLLFGPYKTQRFQYGDVVFCDVRGQVVIVGLSASLIPWPIGKRGRAKSLVIYHGLTQALRRESALAVAHWWGVTAQTITKWRKALGIGRTTVGSLRLWREHSFEPAQRDGLKKAWSKARDPQRRAKIAAAKLGKPRPPHVVQAIIEAHRGMRHTAKTRRKMSEAHRRRGIRPPKAGRAWAPEEDELVRTLPAKEVSERTGRTLKAVYARRCDLGVPDGRMRGRGQ